MRERFRPHDFVARGSPRGEIGVSQPPSDDMKSDEAENEGSEAERASDAQRCEQPTHLPARGARVGGDCQRIGGMSPRTADDAARNRETH